MYHTLGDLLPIMAPFADGGLCYDDTGGPGGTNRVTLRINEAVKRLLPKLGSAGTIECVRFCVHNGCVTCPRDIRKILKGKIDGYYAHVFDKWYEYLEGGPGMLEDMQTPYVDLIDRGLVCTQYDMPASMRVAVFSDTPELITAELLIRGYDEHGLEVRSQNADGSWYMGETVPITSDVMYYTAHNFSQISSVQKPVTNGYVYLSAFEFDDFADPTTLTREHLAGYHPDETRPQYRRYAFATNAYTEVEDYDYRLNALVKLRYIPMSHTSDVCRLDNIEAIQEMLKALKFYRTDDPVKGKEYEDLAIRLLLEDTDDHETVQAIPEAQIHGFGMGDIELV